MAQVAVGARPDVGAGKKGSPGRAGAGGVGKAAVLAGRVSTEDAGVEVDDVVTREEGQGGKPGAVGVQCTGHVFLNRYCKSRGTQLSLAEGRLLGTGNEHRQLIRPTPTYKIIKLCAEFLRVQSAAELKMAQLHGKEMNKRLAIFRVLGALDLSFLASTLQQRLERGGDELNTGLVFHEPLFSQVKGALEFLPVNNISVLRHFVAAMRSRGLLSLGQLSELIYVLGKNVDSTDHSLLEQLEHLAQLPEKIVAEEDVDLYFKWAERVKGSAERHHFLEFAPKLALEFGEVKDGVVRLARKMSPVTVPDLGKDWLSVKTVAVLYDALGHLSQSRKRMLGTPGVGFQLGCLACINRTFMNARQKKDVINGVRSPLDAADLDIFKELSVNAKHATINPKYRIARSGRRIQKHILENYLFNLEELAELLTDLSHHLFVPAELYRSLVEELGKQKLLKEPEVGEILGKMSGDDKLKGVLMMKVAGLFREKFRPRLEALETISSSAYSSSSGESSSGESSSAVSTVGEAEVGGPECEISLLLLHDFVILKKRGPRRFEFNLEAYQKALEFLRGAEVKGDKKTGLGYLASAVERKRPLPIAELCFVMGLIGKYKCVGKKELAGLLGNLRSAHLISTTVHDSLLNSTATPIAPLALRHIFDKLIVEKE